MSRRKIKNWRVGELGYEQKRKNQPVYVLDMKPVADALAGMYEIYYRSLTWMLKKKDEP